MMDLISVIIVVAGWLAAQQQYAYNWNPAKQQAIIKIHPLFIPASLWMRARLEFHHYLIVIRPTINGRLRSRSPQM